MSRICWGRWSVFRIISLSFSILKDPKERVRDFCLVEHDEEIEQFRTNIRIRHLITEKYKLTLYNGFPGYGDLFSRINDPLEIQNLWYDENYSDTRNKLVEKRFHENLNAQSRYPKRLAMS
ncbi:hypothetical protein LCGC14_0806680 [marine sediment metagenome]|uniref:N-sulphoglucosamine sulphohydrolase C-terminal domain-containing protein n=1 Tax=marine sediment metagenome TaxID=412755 RepID=A0A0F9PMY6_9ZZZZ|nr:MAG: hypothetical protein Lokiarch_23110 [Candidatus Lokiarchaeum sp. GC14_75]